MSPTIPQKGYYKLTDVVLDRRPSGDHLVSVHFVHTNDSDVRAMAMVPHSMATPEWMLEVYLKFNSDHPEALQHTQAVLTASQRLYDGPA